MRGLLVLCISATLCSQVRLPPLPFPIPIADPQAEYWKAQNEDFRRVVNEYVAAWDKLFADYRAGKWDVKQARKVERLSEKVYKHPLFRK